MAPLPPDALRDPELWARTLSPEERTAEIAQLEASQRAHATEITASMTREHAERAVRASHGAEISRAGLLIDALRTPPPTDAELEAEDALDDARQLLAFATQRRREVETSLGEQLAARHGSPVAVSTIVSEPAWVEANAAVELALSELHRHEGILARFRMDRIQESGIRGVAGVLDLGERTDDLTPPSVDRLRAAAEAAGAFTPANPKSRIAAALARLGR